MGAKYFGASVRRTEDPRFLRGEGTGLSKSVRIASSTSRVKLIPCSAAAAFARR